MVENVCPSIWTFIMMTKQVQAQCKDSTIVSNKFIMKIYKQNKKYQKIKQKYDIVSFLASIQGKFIFFLMILLRKI